MDHRTWVPTEPTTTGILGLWWSACAEGAATTFGGRQTRMPVMRHTDWGWLTGMIMEDRKILMSIGCDTNMISITRKSSILRVRWTSRIIYIGRTVDYGNWSAGSCFWCFSRGIPAMIDLFRFENLRKYHRYIDIHWQCHGGISGESFQNDLTIPDILCENDDSARHRMMRDSSAVM